jgi:hypothetical protein
MDKSRPGILKPALISGLVFGFLGGAPFVGILNCACCSLILSAGFVAAFLHSRDCRSLGLGFDAMAGLKVGLLAGLFYALGDTITSTITGLLFHEAATKWILEILEEIPEVPQKVLDQIGYGLERGVVATMGWDLITNLGFGILFATIGGLIGGAAFKSDPASTSSEPSLPGE